MAEYKEYHEKEMEMFWNFIQERHLIYKRKELWGEDPPWTSDLVMSQYKFTNIARQLDRGTKFVTHYILANEELSDTDMIFNIIVYRIFNKIETFLHHGFLYTDTYSKEKFSKKVHKYELDVDISVWTNAFVVSGLSLTEMQGMDKIDRMSMVFDWTRDQLLKTDAVDIIMADTTMQATYQELIKFTGIGPFLGYQMAVDLSYWHKTLFGEDDFVVLGPGAKRGIKVLFPEHVIKQWGYEYLNYWLRDRQYEFYKDYDINYKELFDDMPIPYLTVMTFENLLCEISKMDKAIKHTGRPRNTYTPTEGVERMQYSHDNEPWNREPLDIFQKEQNRRNYEGLINA